MRIRILYVPPLLAAAGLAAALLTTPVAAALPKCTNTGPNTTQCQTAGSTQIVTSPPPNNFPWGGWPWGGGLVIGIGGIGIGW